EQGEQGEQREGDQLGDGEVARGLIANLGAGDGVATQRDRAVAVQRARQAVDDIGRSCACAQGRRQQRRAAVARRDPAPGGEGERLRTALLDAAGELLAQARDVDELSVRAVTARAGVSPTALYLHFADKEALVVAVKKSCFEGLGAVLREADAKHEGDPGEQLRAMGRAYLRFAREQPGRYAILFHTQHTPAQP